jgi:quinol monooxygenase YgiN
VIVRLWEAEVASDRVEEFTALVASTILPAVMAADGCLGGEVLRPLVGEDEDTTRVIGITRWRDQEALQTLLGPMWRVRPMWEELELEYVTRPPRVWHFEPVEPRTGAPRRASPPAPAG